MVTRSVYWLGVYACAVASQAKGNTTSPFLLRKYFVYQIKKPNKQVAQLDAQIVNKSERN